MGRNLDANRLLGSACGKQLCGRPLNSLVRRLMSGEQVAAMSPLIQKVFESSEDGWCATFEIVGVRDAWAQVTKGRLNIAYPFDSPPDLEAIAAELPGVAIVSWEEDTYATYSFNDASPSMVAKAVDRLFEKYFSPGGYSVNCRIKNL